MSPLGLSVTIITLLGVVQYGTSLDCYSCQGTIPCYEKPDSVEKVTCKHSSFGEVDSKESFKCAKIDVSNSSTLLGVLRGCVYNCTNVVNTYFDKSTTPTCYTCDTDNCNGTNQLYVSYVLMLAASFFVIFKYL